MGPECERGRWSAAGVLQGPAPSGPAREKPGGSSAEEECKPITNYFLVHAEVLFPICSPPALLTLSFIISVPCISFGFLASGKRPKPREEKDNRVSDTMLTCYTCKTIALGLNGFPGLSWGPQTMTSLLIYALKQSTQHLSHCWGSRHVRNNVQYYNSAASLFSYQFLFFSSIEFIKVIPVLNSKSICGLHFQSKWAKQGNIVPLFFCCLFLSTVEHPSPAQ